MNEWANEDDIVYYYQLIIINDKSLNSLWYGVVWYDMYTSSDIIIMPAAIQSAAATRNDNNDIYNSKEQHALE